MQLAILSAVLLAVAAAEQAQEPVAGVAWRLVLVAAAAVIAPIAALVRAQHLEPAFAARPFSDEREQAASRLERMVICLWLAAVVVILFIGRWPQVVRANWRLAEWPLVDELLVLAPVIGPLLLIWAAIYRLDRSLEVAAYAARNVAPPPADLMGHVQRQARHHLALVLLPPLALVGAIECLERFGITAARLDAAWWLAVPLLVTMLVLMPLAVRRIWRTEPLADGPLRATIEGLCQSRRCAVRDVLVWHTGGTIANAAAVGMSRRLRFVLISDVLLARLSAGQVAAVVRHELAHLARWHLPLRLAMLLLPVSGWLAARHVWPELPRAAQTLAESLGPAGRLASAVAMPLAMLAYAVVVVGWYSRLLEHDADLEACLDDGGQFDPAAAEHFVTALASLSGGGDESRLSRWMHPAFVERLHFIERVANQPLVGRRFRRRLWSVAAALTGFYVLAGAALLRF